MAVTGERETGCAGRHKKGQKPEDGSVPEQ